MKNLFLISALCISCSVFAQEKDEKVAKNDTKNYQTRATNNKSETEGLFAMDQLITVSDGGNYKTFDYRYQGLLGTPYFADEWMKSEVIMSDGRIAEFPLKYDVYNKEVRIKRSLGDSIVLYPYQIKGFRILNQENNTMQPFVKIEHLKTSKGILPITFLYIIHNNKVGLFKHYSKIIRKADYKGAYNAVNRTYDLLEDNSEYFFKKPDNSLVQIKFSKKSVLEAMNDKEEAIKSYLDKEKISIKSENDLIKVIQYYENL